MHKTVLVVSECCKIRTNEEINLLIKQADVIGCVKARGIGKIGHKVRVNKESKWEIITEW